jgi:sterol desaturase/sphingolipid hydroxylase (fatty acid hydroxylase superfamily)
MKEADKVAALAKSNGPLAPGSGLLSGVTAMCLSILCFLGVLAMRFPAYLTTPELRQKYDTTTIRYLIFAVMIGAALTALYNCLFGRLRWLALAVLTTLAATELIGGPFVPIPDFPDHTLYIGLDWLALDLLGSAVIFIVIEKLFAHRKQAVFRAEWQTDTKHFAMNHLAIGVVFFSTNRIMPTLLKPLIHANVQNAVHALPYLVQLFCILLFTDLVQYAVHRALHEVPFLWRFHSVHHSVKVMDWLAGSRQSFLELLTTRSLVFMPIYFFGFRPEVLNAYVVIVGFQAVFNHCNVRVRLGPLRYLFVTPNFHHWHHAQDKEAIDKNYAAHFAFIDYLFGTAVDADRPWPDNYGVVGDYVPDGFVAQQLFPFSATAKANDPKK